MQVLDLISFRAGKTDKFAQCWNPLYAGAIVVLVPKLFLKNWNMFQDLIVEKRNCFSPSIFYFSCLKYWKMLVLEFL